MVNSNTIGIRLKTLRKDIFNLTQAAFSKVLRVDRSHIANLEKDNKQPSESLVRLICLEYGVSETWLKTGAGEMFISPEDVLKQQKARLGERAFLDAVNSIMKEHGLAMAAGRHPHRADTGDQELDNMINTIYDLWASGEDMQGWLKVQFRHAFPADVIEETQKKQQETSRQASAG